MKNPCFAISTPYDTGIAPRVALSANNSVVEVHHTQSGSGLWYHVGQLIGDTCNFGPSINYDSGMPPSVALNNTGVVVEMHQTQNPFSSGMYYHVGAIDVPNQSINFGNSINFDNGNLPSVALNDNNVVVEVHESNGASSNMWCHVGIVNPAAQTIEFGSSQHYDSGSTPCIAINNSGIVVEVHQSDGLSTNLFYHVGTVDTTNKSISFGTSTVYDSGQTPSVALSDDGYVIEIHQSQTFATLWLRVGQVDINSQTITWLYANSYEYGTGTNPSVATNGNMAIEVNQNGDTLYYSASMFMDRSNWMSNNLNLIGNKQLKQIVLPASHDAGMSVVNDCTTIATFGANSCNTQTQTQSVLQQLQNGSRYFDIRPVIYNSQLYTGHFDDNTSLGCNGPLLSDILTQVSTFMQTSSDLIILKFSHYYDRDGGTFSFTDPQMEVLCSQVTSALQSFLFNSGTSSGPLANVTVNTYISTGGRVLAVFDSLDDTVKSKYTGIYSYADLPGTADLVVSDEYAATNDLNTMISTEIGYLTNTANHMDNLFLLSWTLTQSKRQAIACGAHVGVTSILDLAAQANNVLFSNMITDCQSKVINQDTIPNLLYIDNYDGFAADVALWLNQNIPASSSGQQIDQPKINRRQSLPELETSELK